MENPYQTVDDLPESTPLLLPQHSADIIVMNGKRHPYLQAWYSEERVVPALRIGSLVCIKVQLQHEIGTFDGEVIGLSLSHRKALPIDVYLLGTLTHSKGVEKEDTQHFLVNFSSITAFPRTLLALRSGIWKATNRFLRSVPPLQERRITSSVPPYASIDVSSFVLPK